MAKRARITFHDGKTATVHFAEGMSDEQKKAEVTKIEQDYLKKYPAPQKEEGGGEERTWGEFAQDTAEFLGMTDGKRDEGDEGMKAFPEAFEEHAPKATMHGAGPYGAKGVTADMKAAGKLHTGGVDTGAGALTTVRVTFTKQSLKEKAALLAVLRTSRVTRSSSLRMTQAMSKKLM